MSTAWQTQTLCYDPAVPEGSLKRVTSTVNTGKRIFSETEKGEGVSDILTVDSVTSSRGEFSSRLNILAAPGFGARTPVESLT